MTGARGARLPWAVWAGVILLVVPTVVLTWLNGNFSDDPYFVAAALTMIAGYSTVGALIASRDPNNAIGWLLMTVGVGFLLGGFSNEYVEYSYVTSPGSLPVSPAFALVTNSFWLPTLVAVILIVLLFPSGRVPSPRWRLLPKAIVGLAVVATIAGPFFPGPMELDVEGVRIDNPIGVEALDPLIEVVTSLGWVGTLLVGGPLSIAALVLRYRRSRGEERQQLRWLVYIAATTAGVIFLSFVVGLVLGDRYEESVIADALFIAAFTPIGIGVPAAVGIAVLKYRLYDLDLVIKKTLVATVVVVAATAASVVALLLLSGIVVGPISDEPVLTLAAGLAIGASLWPALRLARRLADRIVYGGRATPYEVLTEFAGRMAEAYSTDDVLPRMASILGEGSAASSVTIWLLVGGEFRPAAGWPAERRPEGPASRPELGAGAFEVRHQGEPLGAISVEMPANDPMTPSKERLIRDLASQAGLVLRNVRLIEELRESRRRIVAAVDEGRRRLERNIHDGAQQQLVALAVKLRLADAVVERDPAKAHELLAQLQSETTDALENLRDLARGIYPPLLADEGLAAALEAQARKSPVPVVVTPDGIGRYPQDVEASVYFCVLEALNNVAKYANATRVDVELRHDDGRLAFAVRDDGVGFDPSSAPRGSGLQGMADRMDAVGGTFALASERGGGTEVTGSVPVAQA